MSNTTFGRDRVKIYADLAKRLGCCLLGNMKGLCLLREDDTILHGIQAIFGLGSGRPLLENQSHYGCS